LGPAPHATGSYAQPLRIEMNLLKPEGVHRREPTELPRQENRNGKRRKRMQCSRGPRFNLLTAFFVLLSSALISGCGLEPEDEESALGIQPVAITLDATEIADVVFTVWGGAGVYAWSISDDSLGTIVSGDTTAIYTSKAAAGENTVTVTDGSSSISAVVSQE